MKIQFLLLLLIASIIGCKKEVKTDELYFEGYTYSGDYSTANYSHETRLIRSDDNNANTNVFTFSKKKWNKNDFYWTGDGGGGATPERMRLDAEGVLVLFRNGDSKDNNIPLVFTKKKARSYTVRDGDIIESIDYNTLKTLPVIQVGIDHTSKNYDLEMNMSNNVDSWEGVRRCYHPEKFAKWLPKNKRYLLH